MSDASDKQLKDASAWLRLVCNGCVQHVAVWGAAAACWCYRAGAWLGRTFVQFWTKPIRAEPLALFRIVASLTMMASALTSILPDLHLFWSPDGIASNEFYHDYAHWSDRYSILYLATTDAHVTIIFVVWMAALACLAVGYKTRVAAIVSFVIAWSFSHRMIYVLNGGDDVGMQALFYLMLAPAGAVWSVDAWRRKRLLQGAVPNDADWIDWSFWRRQNRLAHNYIPPWSVRLIQIQLCCIYFFTGIAKLDPSVWEAIVSWDLSQTKNDYVTGEAVYWVLNDITLTRWSYASLPVPMWMCRIASWGTIVFELGFPLLMLFRAVRPWVLGIGVLFHLSIFLTMEIGWFSQFTVCYYAVFLSAAGAVRFGNLLGVFRVAFKSCPARLRRCDHIGCGR